jgi:hypothetical protein
MSNRERIEQTEQRLAQVESLQLKLDETQKAIVSYRQSLVQKLALLRQNGPASNRVQAAPARDRYPVAKPAGAPPAPVNSSSAPAPVSAATVTQAPDKERRTSPRRKGNPVPVQISTANATMEAFQGWVLDRSQGGLRILVDQPVIVGTELSVRPTKAHGSFPWIKVKVRSCQAERGSYSLGVQFVAKLAWGELQGFG